MRDQSKISPVIGKTVLETLTSGMYEDPRFIFREYIQNSADQIDIAVEEEIIQKREQGKINICIDDENREIIIEDNATGVKTSKIRKFLGDIGNSEKDISKRKGFRGIGRLGGLGYCDKLIFETTYKGESVKNTMILNAKLLKEIISNRNDDSDASSVISLITKIETAAYPISAHFFKVTLIGVTNDLILNTESVLQYLSIVAPVPFSPKFKYKDKIKNHFKTKNLAFDEYKTTLNGTLIFKAYKNLLKVSKSIEEVEITSIGFFDVRDNSNQLLAIGWYGISTKINEVIDKTNVERGIRIRKNNITIGNEQTLFERFRADRTNLRYIGEIHVLGDGFIPNARRDYFTDNKTLEQFEKSLNIIFQDFESKLPHKASDLHNRLKNIVSFRKLAESYSKDKTKFKTDTEQEQRLDEVMSSLKIAKDAGKKIAKIKAEASSNPQLNDLFESIIGDYEYLISNKELIGLYSKNIYPPLKFSKVTRDQEKILNEVVIFLQTELGHREADKLIIKLQKRYNLE